MRIFSLIIIACIFFFFNKPLDSAEEEAKEIAVIKARYDKIEKVLNKYKIQYKLYDYNDLNSEKIFTTSKAIFFPCGIDKPIETNINILSRGTKIHSVSLKEDFVKIDTDEICKNIKSFVSNGGTAYFSGYSFNLFNGAFNSMEFYDNFPNLGIRGRIDLELNDDLKYFCKIHKTKVYMPHPGWIVVKSIRGSDILADSEFNTIRGEKRSPVISDFIGGKGRAIYTSYHKTSGYDEVIRYIIYRTAFNNLLNKLLEKISAWEQVPNSTVIDSVREWEDYRSYIIPVKKGQNTLYFLTNQGPFQLDILDKENNLIVSMDSRRNEFKIDLQSDSYDYYVVKIYPGNPVSLGTYAIASASGIRILPYYKKITYFLVFTFIILIFFWINRIFGPKKFSGRKR